MGGLSQFKNNEFQKFLFQELMEHAINKGFNNSTWAKAAGVYGPDLSNIRNGIKGVSENKFKKIVDPLGLTKKQLEEMTYSAKQKEMELYYQYEKDDTYINEEDVEEVLFSKNGIKLTNQSKSELDFALKLLKEKYPE